MDIKIDWGNCIMTDEIVVTETPKKKDFVNEWVGKLGVGAVFAVILIVIVLLWTIKNFEGQPIKNVVLIALGAGVLVLVYNKGLEQSNSIIKPYVAIALIEEEFKRRIINGGTTHTGKPLRECSYSKPFLEGDIQTVDGLPRFYQFGMMVDGQFYASRFYLEGNLKGVVTFRYFPTRVRGSEVNPVVYQDTAMMRQMQKNPLLQKIFKG